MKIAARDRRILIRKDDRIVGHRTAFNRQRARGVAEEVERGAHHLGLAAEAVGILDLAAAAMAVENLGTVEQCLDRSRNPDLPGLAAQLRNPRIERLNRALERI